MTAVCNVADYAKATRLLSATTLRCIIKINYKFSVQKVSLSYLFIQVYHSVNTLPLRNILGTKTLSELLSDRENIATDLKSMIDTATDPWGIDVSGQNIISQFCNSLQHCIKFI